MEGPRPGGDGWRDMSDLSSGKGAADENFPVASRLVAPRHREVVMRFYAVARMADDIADHAMLAPERKIELLAEIEATLDGAGAVPEAVALREALAARGLTDRHVRDLLVAFRQDATESRYADWDALMTYCRYSAAPVGRFMLDVHGEDRSTWPASDALCAALQIINHLQDCAKDYRELDRVYMPLDALTAAGATVDDLGEGRSTAALLAAIRGLAARTSGLLADAKRLSPAVRDTRLALEVGVIQTLAESLNRRLLRRDPLADRVHHTRDAALGLAAWGAISTLVWRFGSRQGRRIRA
jgi:squalene synthase HpnC